MEKSDCYNIGILNSQRFFFSTHALQAWYALRTIQKIDLKNRIAIQKASIRNGRCFS